MAISTKIVTSFALAALTSALVSCGGNAQKAPIDNINLEDTTAVESFGFSNKDFFSGSIYVNASSYADWQYIDLENAEITSVKVGEAAPEKWDFAVHRFDVKTNGGAGFETDFDDLSKVADIQSVESLDFTADATVSDKIIVDMSGMMQGKVKYAEDSYNPCISKWMDMNMKNMPPEFNLSDKVYLLRTAEGKIYGLHFKNYVNKSNELGYLTIDYITKQ